MEQVYKIALFTVYTIFWEAMVWGLTASSIYYLHWSEWTVVVGILMSASQLKPKHFGIETKEKQDKEKE